MWPAVFLIAGIVEFEDFPGKKFLCAFLCALAALREINIQCIESP